MPLPVTERHLSGACTLIVLSFCFLFSCIHPATSFAQDFDVKGMYQLPVRTELYPDTTTLTRTRKIPDEKEKRAMIDRIVKRLDTTLANLDNPLYKLEDRYEFLFSATFYVTFKAKVKLLRDYLLYNTGDPQDPLLPTKSELDALWLLDQYEDVVYTNDQDKFVREAVLPKKDLLTEYLITRFNTTRTSDRFVNKSAFNYDDIKDWRKLEEAYATLRDGMIKLKEWKSDIFNFDQTKVTDLENTLATVTYNGNRIIAGVQGSLFIQKWLWYTGGIPNINPLLVTTPELRYPAGELCFYITPDLRAKQDSLDKSTFLSDFIKSRQIYNKVLLPVAKADDKQLFRLKQYDASQDYKSKDGLELDMLNAKYKLRLAVHNVPNNKEITYSNTYEALKFESQFTTDAKAFASELSSLTTLIAPNIALFNSIQANLNRDALKKINKTITAPTLHDKKMGIEKQYFEKIRKELRMREDTIVVTPTIQPPATVVILNGKLIPVKTDNDIDKRNILWIGGTSIHNFTKDADSSYQIIVKQFLFIDRANPLDYSDVTTLTASANEMIKRFNDYIDMLKANLDELDRVIGLYEPKFKELDAFVSITNRSLPPGSADIKPTLDKNAQFTSFHEIPTLPDPPRKITYSLTEVKSAAGKSETKVVVKQSIKVVKPTRLDFSIGLAFTGQAYQRAIAPETGLPNSEAGQRLKFAAGMHFYPIPINKLNDGWFTNTEERFSIYAGLSLSKALENYYTGLSYDVTPGLKLIGGAHFYKNYRFKIVNNQVADKAAGVELAGPFISLALDPSTVVSAIGLFK